MRTIGIDLATRQTGIIEFNSEGKLLKKELLKLKTFSNENMRENVNQIIKSITLWTLEEKATEIYVELSNYGNLSAQMFSYYAGVITGYVWGQDEAKDINIQFIDPSAWQTLLKEAMGVKSKRLKDSKNQKFINEYYFYDLQGNKIDEYKTIKDVAKAYVNKYENITNWSQDEIDAYCIGKFGKVARKLWTKKTK